MDKFKRFEDLLSPDPFQAQVFVYDRRTRTTVPESLELIYRNVQTIRLHRSVPIDLRRYFQRAKNLLVYSWFVFAFLMSAQLHAYITTELALRRRLGSNATFKKLLIEAIQRDLLTADGFKSLRGLRNGPLFQVGPELEEEIVTLASDLLSESDYPRALLDVLGQRIPALRNELAHGFVETHSGGFQSVALCADVINQLFAAERVDRNTAGRS